MNCFLSEDCLIDRLISNFPPVQYESLKGNIYIRIGKI